MRSPFPSGIRCVSLESAFNTCCPPSKGQVTATPRFSSCGADARPPSPDAMAILFIYRSKRALERGLLVRYDEEMSGEKENESVNQESYRPVEQSRTGKGERRAEVHRIAHISVRPAYHQAPRRVERSWSAFPDRHEGEY